MKINPGDTVEYIDTGFIKVGKQLKSIKVSKHGIWDGKQVILDDKERTTVYNVNWLTRVKTTEDKIIDFGEWYSGMEREKVKNAYKRFLKETNHE